MSPAAMMTSVDQPNASTAKPVAAVPMAPRSWMNRSLNPFAFALSALLYDSVSSVSRAVADTNPGGRVLSVRIPAQHKHSVNDGVCVETSTCA